MDRIRNEYLKQRLLDALRESQRGQARWFEYVRRRDSKCIGRPMTRLELPRWRSRRRPKRRFMDAVRGHEVSWCKERTQNRIALDGGK